MMWLRRTVEDTEQHFWAHVAAHLTMLYGVLSQDWLPSTDVAFNMPAWSISLEWQFYLIAPFVVWLLVKRPGLAPMLALTLVVLQMLFYRGWFGSYHQLATLLAVSGLFAVGVASRMIYPTLTEGRIKSFHVPLAGCIVLAAFTNEMALAIWAMVYIGFIVRQPSRIYQYALESPIVLYLGSRSYGVYLVHFIVLVVVQHVTTRLLGTAPQFLALTAMVVPATLLLSELMYRMVELPGIRLGSRLCRKLQPDKRAVFRRAA
jgi:peptidoglycan/LPS O-acetylase OafA/YrhL